MMQQAIQHGANGGGITKQLAPILDGAIGGE
jgi:hypothetical protein